MNTTRLIVLIAGTLAFASPVAAQSPAAVVEDTTGNQSGVEFMDYVEVGKVIHLGPNDSIVLSYIKSCVRETIRGGTMTVGTEQSDVQSGTVKRMTVKCDAGKMLLTSQQSSQTASYILRSVEPSNRSLSEPQVTLYGSSPIIELTGGGEVVIERLDQSGERHVLKIDSKPHGAFYDFASDNASLVPGGTYNTFAGNHRAVFKIDPGAKAGPTPIVGRLIRLGPTN